MLMSMIMRLDLRKYNYFLIFHLLFDSKMVLMAYLTTIKERSKTALSLFTNF